jgi:hypothetical protein
MSARFRIRTPSGQELSFASLDVFREFVRSGDLSPDDVVYDAETREWSSARTHPVVLEIEEASEEANEAGGAAATASGIDEPSAESAASPDMDDIGLDLAPAPSQLSPEEQAAAFVAKMAAERAADLSLDGGLPIQGFNVEQGAPTLADPVSERPPEPPPPAPAPYDAPVEEDPFRRERPAARVEPERKAPGPSRAPPRVRSSGAGRKYVPVAVLVLGVIGGVIYFGPALLAPQATEGSDPEEVVTPSPPAPIIPATEEAVRARASERFLAATQAQLRGLAPIPQTWLSGRYLATPSDYAHVREVWQAYVTTMREVRAGEEERYRAAYLRALDDAGVQGPARATRLSAGMSQFQNGAAARNRHYDNVESLATVAVGGHDELVEAEGRILYEPATGQRVSADPVIEAVGRTAADQALLEEILDAILAELQGEGGAGTAPNVREWVYGGLLDAVTN